MKRSPSTTPPSPATVDCTVRNSSVLAGSGARGTTRTRASSTVTAAGTTGPSAGSRARSSTVCSVTVLASSGREKLTVTWARGDTCPAPSTGDMPVTASRGSVKAPSAASPSSATGLPWLKPSSRAAGRFARTKVVAMPSGFTTEAERMPFTGRAS